MSKVIIAATTLALANDMLVNDLTDVPVTKLTSEANVLAEAIGEKTLKKDKNRDAALQRLKDNAKLVIQHSEGKVPEAEAPATEEAEAPAAEGKKKVVGKKKVAAPRRKAIEFKIKHEDGKVETGKLINSVPAGAFSDVKEIVVDRELNEKAYFNTAYFTKRSIEVKIDPAQFESTEPAEEK